MPIAISCSNIWESKIIVIRFYNKQTPKLRHLWVMVLVLRILAAFNFDIFFLNYQNLSSSRSIVIMSRSTITFLPISRNSKLFSTFQLFRHFHTIFCNFHCLSSHFYVTINEFGLDEIENVKYSFIDISERVT